MGGSFQSFVVQGSLSEDELESVLRRAGTEVQGRNSFVFGDCQVALFVAQKYFFRTSDFVGATLVAISRAGSQRIELASAGGGSGVLGVQLGAGEKLEDTLRQSLIDALKQKGFAFTDAVPDV
jgi:hypothetical protein